MRQLLVSILLCLSFFNSFSQKKCGADEYQQRLNQDLKNPLSEEQFEEWLYKQRLDRSRIKSNSASAEETVYTIPVVVHIIHKGESLGNSSNVPDEQVFSQIDVLNGDFRRTNADASETPTDFVDVAADIQIEFALAKRDPEGLPTTGIVRKEGALDDYSYSNDRQLKSESYWPAEDYLNIWVTDIDDSDQLIGYAQFPMNNLGGLDTEDQNISRLTDGVVIDYRFFGVGFNADDFSKGRTATHEIGHFLGLKHLWGTGGGCSNDDFCNDTPLQSSSTSPANCPDPGSVISCSSPDMFQNYMDFSADVCMNLFTICQKDRMRTVLESAPRRKSLLTSKALEDPIVVANDLGIRQVLSPLNGNCQNTIVPQIEVRNYGTNTITEFSVDLFIDDTLEESITQNTTLSELSTAVVSFASIPVSQSGSYAYRFEITTTNGGSDGNSENDSKALTVSFPEETILPYSEDFNNASEWHLSNSSGATPLWSHGNAPYEVIDDTGMVLSYFDTPTDKFGELDVLSSPVFDLSSLPSADLSFRYAYAPVAGLFSDVFTVVVSTDCGTTFPDENIIYQRFGSALATTDFTSQSFIPQGSSEWRDITINITEFVGNQYVVIGFIGHNGGGNNLYLDDFSLSSENTLNYDLAINSVENLSAVSCDDSLFPSVEIKNKGVETLTSFTFETILDGNSEAEQINNISVLPGKSYTHRPTLRDVGEGNHTAIFAVSNPNGELDQNEENDTQIVNFEINTAQLENPTQQYFENIALSDQWSIVRPDDTHNWQLTNAPSASLDNQAIFIDGFNISEIGIENWLVSPELDFTVSDEASLSFKLSYANVPNREDRLRILLSVNCGRSYEETIYDKRGADLAITQQSSTWTPTAEDDWKTEIIDLSQYSIWPNVRVAFVVTNQNGNNLFLDDIEFFTTADPYAVDIGEEKMRAYPNPTNDMVNLKFDLADQTDLELKLVNVMGKVVKECLYPGTLRQTYQIGTLNLENGLYLIHVQGNGVSFSRRLLIWN